MALNEDGEDPRSPGVDVVPDGNNYDSLPYVAAAESSSIQSAVPGGESFDLIAIY